MTPETVVIVEEPPPLASVTVLPETGLLTARPCSVTVTVEVVAPSASNGGRRRSRPSTGAAVTGT